MRAITPEQMQALQGAEELELPSPIPTQIVSSDEYLPAPQTEKQREVEARLKDLGNRLAERQGVSRRRFFQTAAGMAASYLVMNQVYGPLFSVARAETTTPELADARAESLKNQFILDAHTHFIRDDPAPFVADPKRIGGLMWQRTLTAKAGWNKDMAGKPQTVEDLKFDNFMKEIYLDSDTKLALHQRAVRRSQGLAAAAGRRVQGTRTGEQGGGRRADDGPFHPDARPARLAGRRRPRH